MEELIYSYTRAQAIEDGVLVDLTETAREAGFRLPTACTSAVWSLIETIPERYSHEDVAGRTWDMLWMGMLAAKRAKPEDREMLYEFILHADSVPDSARAKDDIGVYNKDQVRFKLHVGPGDKGEPVITIMLPDED